MSVEIEESMLRGKLAKYMDRAVDDNEVFIVKRRNGKHVAILPAAELSSMMETAHLMSSPANAERLLSAARSVREGRSKPISIEQLRTQLGLEE